MPAPDAAAVAYLIVFGVPLLLLVWYAMMYRDIGAAGFTGGELMEGESGPEPEPEGEAEPEA